MPGAGTRPPTSFHAGCGHASPNVIPCRVRAPERGISVACHTIIGYARALPCAIACRPVGAMGCDPPQRHSMRGAGTHPPTSFHAGCGHPSVESPWRAIRLLDTQGRCPMLLHVAPLGLWDAAPPNVIPCGVRARIPQRHSMRGAGTRAWNLRGVPYDYWIRKGVALCYCMSPRWGYGMRPHPTSFHAGCRHPERGISVACHTIIGYARALPCAIACRPVGAMGCGPPQRHSMPGAGTHPPTSFHALGAGTRSVESPWRAIRLLDTQGRCPVLLHVAPLGLWDAAPPNVIPCRVPAPGAWNLRGVPYDYWIRKGVALCYCMSPRWGYGMWPPPTSFHAGCGHTSPNVIPRAGCGHPERGISVACHRRHATISVRCAR
jgi:hypothetical protein